MGRWQADALCNRVQLPQNFQGAGAAGPGTLFKQSQVRLLHLQGRAVEEMAFAGHRVLWASAGDVPEGAVRRPRAAAGCGSAICSSLQHVMQQRCRVCSFPSSGLAKKKPDAQEVAKSPATCSSPPRDSVFSAGDRDEHLSWTPTGYLMASGTWLLGRRAVPKRVRALQVSAHDAKEPHAPPDPIARGRLWLWTCPRTTGAQSALHTRWPLALGPQLAHRE